MSDEPLVVLFGEHGADQAHRPAAVHDCAGVHLLDREPAVFDPPSWDDLEPVDRQRGSSPAV